MHVDHGGGGKNDEPRMRERMNDKKSEGREEQ